MNIISLQDEYKSNGSSYGVGVDVSGKMPGSNKEEGYAIPSLNGSYSQDSADSKWVNNQTSIIAENGGSIKVGETLTNVGSIIGSLNPNEKLSIDANKVVVENLKDHDNGENSGIQLSGISKDTLIPQTGIQYGSHDKQQDSNATFVNTEVTEAGKKLDLDELGINTDINKAQVITKDEVVEQIDTVLHTDLGNQKVRDQFVEDILKTGSLVPEIVQGIQEGTKNEGETILGQISNNMGERSDDIKAFVEGRDQKLQEQLDKYKNEDGKIVMDADAQKLIEDSLRQTLEEFGKGDYKIEFFEGDPDQIMGVDDKNGIVYINVNGHGAGNAEEMRKNMQHDGSHGTYVNKDVDEDSAKKVGQINGDRTESNLIADESIKDKIKEGTDAYNKAVENGDIRNLLDKVVDVKNSKYFDAAQSTLDKVCSGRAECLGELYGFKEEDANKKNNENNLLIFTADLAETALIGGLTAFIPGSFVIAGKTITVSKVISSGGSVAKIIYDAKDIIMDDNTRKELYKLTVAKIELERSRVAADIYSKEYHEFYELFSSNGTLYFSERQMKAYNAGRKIFGKSVLSEKEIKDRIWRLNNYMSSGNPDYYLEPRSLERKVK